MAILASTSLWGVRTGLMPHALLWNSRSTTVLIGIITVGVAVAARAVRLANTRDRRKLGLLYMKRRNNRRCPRCSGFGIVRCRLCGGEGVVRYEKKLAHVDVCPVCAMKRYVPCNLCSGFGTRPTLSATPSFFVKGSSLDVAFRTALNFIAATRDRRRR
ncbi:hypothetical protein FVE85_6808 [Porphyridium purpureum]|uniref:Uncharacterized protein n=1 Tax=Porphyridium purpureum TaxID=35688 RepID=A0A5J4Z8X2_PORPP|nr:hypothetical protein FVE85_6808 [Porphyridium purpureum]|eukprot:POR6678..scf295_1